MARLALPALTVLLVASITAVLLSSHLGLAAEKPVYEVYPDKLVTPYGYTISYEEIKAATPSTLAYALAIVAEEEAKIVVHSGDYDVGRVEVSSYAVKLEVVGIGRVVVRGTVIAENMRSLVFDNIVFQNSGENPSLIVANVYSARFTRLLFETPVLLKAYNVSVISIEDSVGTAGVLVNASLVAKLSISNSAITANESLVESTNTTYMVITGGRIYAGKTLAQGTISTLIVAGSFIDTRGSLVELRGETSIAIRRAQVTCPQLVSLENGEAIVELEDSKITYTSQLLSTLNSSLALVFSNTVIQPSQPLSIGYIGGDEVVLSSKPVAKTFAFALLWGSNTSLSFPLDNYYMQLAYTSGSGILGFIAYPELDGRKIALNLTYYRNDQGDLGAVLVGVLGRGDVKVRIGEEEMEAVRIGEDITGLRIPEALLKDNRVVELIIASLTETTPPPPTTTSPAKTASPSPTTTTPQPSPTATTTATPSPSTTTTQPPPPTTTTVNETGQQQGTETVRPRIVQPQVTITPVSAKPSPLAVIGSVVAVVVGAGWLAYSQIRRRRMGIGEVVPE